MAIKAIIDNVDTLDAALKPFYEEREGKWVLAVEGIDAHPEIAPLKNAYERTKADRAEAIKRARELADRLAEIEKGKPDEAAVLRLRQELESERDQWRKKAGDLEAQLMAVTRDRAIMEALASAGVTDVAAQRIAARYLADQVKVDGERVIVETDMGPLPIADHVRRWVAGEGRVLVAAPAGGGARGSGDAAASTTPTMTRAQYDALDHPSRTAFLRRGGRLTD